MTYSADSSIQGQATTPAAAVQAWMEQRGRQMAAGYGLNGQYTPVPWNLGKILVEEAATYPGHIADHNIGTGQVADETAGWQSTFARERNNPGGIGAINSDPGQAIWFPYPRAGIRAHYAHLLVYSAGDGPWSPLDPRRDAVAAEKWLAVAPTLRGLNGRWAYPGTTYAQSIADLANQIVAFAAGKGWPAVPGRVPKPQVRTDRRALPGHFDGYSTARHVEAIVCHISDGSQAGDLAQLTTVVSANFYINKAGEIFELVPIEHSAWTNGADWSKGVATYRPDLSNPFVTAWVRAGINPNTRTVSIEHEGKPNDQLTPAQLASTIALQAWLCDECSILPDRTHILGHYQIDDVSRPYCPSFSDGEWAAITSGITRILNGAIVPQPQTPPADDRILVEGNPKGAFGYRSGFKGRLQVVGGAVSPNDVNAGILAWVGWAEEDEWSGVDGCSYQRTERGVLQWTPNTPAPWDIVRRPDDAGPLPAKKA